MRFINALKQDMRFQIRYGFYFLYVFFSAVYIAALFVTPAEYKKMAVSLIILTDPAMLGIFFTGGIWLLEKGEGLHHYWCISPLRPIEYVLAKSISLAILSTISADLIVFIGMGNIVHLASLSASVFFGAAVFNLIGLILASYARSVNHYMLIVSPPTAVLFIPPVLTAFGMTHPLLELFPGTALWRLIANSVGVTVNMSGLTGIVLIFWFAVLLFFAVKRISAALRCEGGEGV